MEVRVAMIGPAGSGKTEMLRRISGLPFRSDYHPTIDKHDSVLYFPGYKFIVTEYSGTDYPVGAQDIDNYILVITEKDRAFAKHMETILPNVPHCTIVNKSDLKRSWTEVSCSALTKENLKRPFEKIASHYGKVDF